MCGGSRGRTTRCRRPISIVRPGLSRPRVGSQERWFYLLISPWLVGLIAPQPGQLAVDCTFGAGGHARRVALELLGAGTYETLADGAIPYAELQALLGGKG